MTEPWRLDAEEFIAVKDRYRLVGALVTEGFNDTTAHLSQWAQNDLARAYAALQSVDMHALNIMVDEKAGELDRLTRAIRATHERGGDVVTYSMGSPYRASIVLNHLWDQVYGGTSMESRWRAYGTGGDVSLIVPVKGVEDHHEYGARKIRESGLRPQDRLIGFVEGGDTPSVLGALQQGAKITEDQVHFAYCNPDDLLYRIGDVAAVHDNPKIDRTNLTVGPMALQGSTRMQASTVLELIIGAAMLGLSMDDIKRFVDIIANFNYRPFIEFTEAETATYESGEYTLYRAREFAVTVGSNHTELCPTFNLAPFDDPTSLTYLSVLDTCNLGEAYRFYTGRKPDIQDWIPGGIASWERYNRLDISEGTGEPQRRDRVPGPMHDFNILKNGDSMDFSFRGLKHSVPLQGMHPLFQHLLLKTIINSHTTLMMGRMGKYEDNFMYFVNVWLNKKLIDRGARIVEEKRRRDGLSPLEYDQIIYALAKANHESTGPNDPPVPKAYEALRLAA